MQDLVQEQREKINLLNQAVMSLKERGTARAKAEQAYRVALSQRLAQLRAEKQPVTHLSDIARGEENIAKLRLERDLADVLYNSAQEAINNYKLQIRIIEAQIQREYGDRNVH